MILIKIECKFSNNYTTCKYINNMYRITYICFKIVYLNVCTSNIFTIGATIATATRGPIARATIGGTAGTSSNINIKTIATIGYTEGTSTIITIITLITTTSETFIATTTTTSVIDKMATDTGAGVSEFKIRWIRARATGAITSEAIISIKQAIRITLIIANNIPLKETELAEWVGFNKYGDNFDYH